MKWSNTSICWIRSKRNSCSRSMIRHVSSRSWYRALTSSRSMTCTICAMTMTTSCTISWSWSWTTLMTIHWRSCSRFARNGIRSRIWSGSWQSRRWLPSSLTAQKRRITQRSTWSLNRFLGALLYSAKISYCTSLKSSMWRMNRSWNKYS